jgi:hypothetical protein
MTEATNWQHRQPLGFPVLPEAALLKKQTDSEPRSIDGSDSKSLGIQSESTARVTMSGGKTDNLGRTAPYH